MGWCIADRHEAQCPDTVLHDGALGAECLEGLATYLDEFRSDSYVIILMGDTPIEKIWASMGVSPRAKQLPALSRKRP